MNKYQFRKQMLIKRANISNKQNKSDKIFKNICNFFKEKNLNLQNLKIASYLSIKNEVSTQLINQNFEIYLPIIHPYKKHCLWFAKDTKKYKKNQYNISEPFHNESNILAPWELDIIIVPLVAFNSKKYRMGMGGGFYDFSFQLKKKFNHPLIIGIAFNEQCNDDIIINEHDIKLDKIITQTMVI